LTGIDLPLVDIPLHYIDVPEWVDIGIKRAGAFVSLQEIKGFHKT